MCLSSTKTDPWMQSSLFAMSMTFTLNQITILSQNLFCQDGQKWVILITRSRKNSLLRANQSLKLTEPAVDDLTRAKQPAIIGRGSPRADQATVAAALRRRSLAPVR